MKQLSQSYKTGVLSLVEVAEPHVSRRSILVDTSVSLISAGTERMLVDLARKSLVAKARERPDLVAKVVDKARREGIVAAFEAVRTKLDNPIPLGYSLAGRVAEVGQEVSEFAVSDRVACAGAGFANHAAVNVVPRNLAVRIPDAVTDEEASFVTVAAIALQGIRLVKPQLGEVVAVLGLGLIGQIAVSLLSAHGCEVVGVDIDPTRVELAKKRGARWGAVGSQADVVEVVRAATGGRGADAIVVCASSSTNEPLVVAGDIARDKAIVSVVGLLPLEIPRKAYYEKELELVVSRSYGPGRYDANYEERGQDYPIGYVRWSERRNMEAVLFAMETGRLDVKELITHRFAFDAALDAYALITGEKPEPHMGVLLTYPPRSASAPRNTPSIRPRNNGALGVAVVGTGAFAASVLVPALAKIANATLVTAVSGRGLSARSLADKFGFRRTESTLEDVLAKTDVDAVVIATRHELHAKQAASVLVARKHVFLEKPAATNEADLLSLVEAARASERVLMIGFNRRFSPFAQRVKDHFAQRSAGLVMSCRVNAGRIMSGSWIVDATEGGGRIVGEVCHFIDLMSFWSKSVPIRISAHAIGDSGGYDRNDNLVVSLSFADGSIGTLTYTAMGDPAISKEYYEVFCEGSVAVPDNWRTLAITSKGKTKTHRAFRSDKGHASELEAFVMACQNGGPSPIALESIEATTRATFAIETAWRSRASIEL